jgi:isoprenylcysteine carboxyl methyltransferase (ICMT) family protein YpbQ
MWTNFTILALVTLQRLVELYIARRNTKRRLANGGIEAPWG